MTLSIQFDTHYTDDGDENDDGDDEMMVIYVHLHTWWRVDGGHRYSQLSSCRVHTCLSMGYLVRSMLQAIVAVMLLCVQSEIIKTPSNTPPHHETLLLLWCRTGQLIISEHKEVSPWETIKRTKYRKCQHQTCLYLMHELCRSGIQWRSQSIRFEILTYSSVGKYCEGHHSVLFLS